MIRFLILVFFGGFSVLCFSQSYETSNIPLLLKNNADAVTRISRIDYKIESSTNIKKHVHYAITILNKSAAKEAVLKVYYDKSSKVSNIRGFIYNSKGEKIRKLKKNQIKDEAYTNDFTLFGDSRIKYADLRYTTYPYTVEFEYLLEYKGIVGYEPWIPRDIFYLAVERADLKVSLSDTSLIRYKQLNSDRVQFSKVYKDGRFVLQWTLDNLNALEFERNSPDFMQFSPCVLLAPNDFWFHRTKGNLTNWKEYGKWVNSLLIDRDEVSPETIKYIKQLTDTISSKERKIKAIYNYVQHKTRYVNISLGIGGFQPNYAMEVDENGYGDCKALSNYTKALLNTIGVESFYAEIGNGKELDGLYNDFANAYKTNHVILMVPNEKDTIWLECTNGYYPCGYIGKGNVNRSAVVITENGGVLAKTPSFSEKDNLKKTITTIKIDEQSNASIEQKSTYCGLRYSYISSLMQLTRKDQTEYLLKNINIPAISLNDFSFTCSKYDIPEANYLIRMDSEKLITKSGKRYFLPVNPLNKTFNLYNSKERKTDVYYDLAFTDIDTIWFEIPLNCKIEYLPKDVHYQCLLGEYSMQLEIVKGKVCCVRIMMRKRGLFPKEKYTEIADFYKKVARADKQKIIYIKRN